VRSLPWLVVFLVSGVALANPPRVRKVYRHKTVTYEGAKVRDVILKRSGEIRACYTTVTRKTPDLYGQVVLEWEIGPQGKVGGISVVESLKRELDLCIASRIKTWIFPEPPGKAVAKVRFPFEFSEVYNNRKPARVPVRAKQKR
jgi:hypothetical protein